MSRLDELIRELCPDGVEYRTLGEIAYYATQRIEANEINSQTYVGVENLLQNKQGKTIASNVPKKGKVIQFKTGDILIGNIRPYLKKIWLSDCVGGTNGDVLTVRVADYNQITPKFLYYVLSSDNFFLYDVQNSRGAKMPRGDKEAIMNYRFPVPPLPVQQEIVRILDTFTALTAELTAELTARKKQYEYYRDRLLSFDENEVQWKTLTDLFVIKNGYTPSKSNKDFWTNGIIPWFRMEDIRTSGRILSDSIQHITPQAVKGKLFPANSIILATTATIGEHALVIVDSLANQRFTFFSKRESLDEYLNIKYMFYYFFIIDEWCKKNIKVSSFPAVDMNKLKQYKIPIPPLEIQNRIVSILDRFDSLCNDLSSGIPAEIEARKKQYEYYRDRLLSFREKKG